MRKGITMKRKSLPVSILVLALMLALGSLGVVYGNWTQALYVNGTVNTATMGVAFDNNPGWAPIVDPDSIVGSINCVPSISSYAVANDTLSLVVNNAAPGYSCTFSNIVLRNTGTVPVSYTTDYTSNAAASWIDLSSQTFGLNSGTIAANGGYVAGHVVVTIGNDAPFNAANDTFQWTITATQQ